MHRDLIDIEGRLLRIAANTSNAEMKEMALCLHKLMQLVDPLLEEHDQRLGKTTP